MSKIDILDEAASLRQKKIDEIVKDQDVSRDYFEFKYSTGQEIGRTFPQVNYISFIPEIHRMNDFSKLPEKDKFNGRVELKKTAKVTDLLSSWQHGNGIMISEKFFEIIRKFNLGKHAFYGFKCIHQDKEYEYIYLALDNQLFDIIDYSQSVFYTTNLFSELMRDITFSSKTAMLQYLDFINKHKYQKEGYKEGLVENDIEIKKVLIKSEYQDLAIVERYSTYFISKNLKDILERNKITGMEFKETRRIFKEEINR